MTSKGRPGRRKKELVHDGGPVTAFALALRELRGQAGNPPYRQMAQQVHVAQNLLSQADSGHRLPTEDAVVAYVTACGGDVEEWKQRLRTARAAHAALQSGATGDAVGQPASQRRPNNPVAQENAAAPNADDASRKTDELPRRAIRRRPTIRTALLAVLAVAAATVTIAVATGWFTSALGGTTSPEPDQALPTSQPESAPPPLQSECRYAWAKLSTAPVHLLPCIQVQPDGLLVSAQVKAADPSGATATIWVWPMNVDQALLQNQRYDLTREPATLRHCRLTLANDSEVKTCGPFKVTPTAGAGVYATASTGHRFHADYPPGWQSTTVAGLQSPMVEFREP
jgi:hypothetical protein